MPASSSNTVQKIRTAHAAISDSCGAISENLRTLETETVGNQVAAPIDSALTPQQCLAIGHLVGGKSYGKTAELVRVNPRTLYEWRKNPVFQTRLNELSAEALEAVAMRSREMLMLGTEKLQQLLDRSSSIGETLRVVANKRIWDMANVMPRALGGDAFADNSASQDQAAPMDDHQTNQ